MTTEEYIEHLRANPTLDRFRVSGLRARLLRSSTFKTSWVNHATSPGSSPLTIYVDEVMFDAIVPMLRESAAQRIAEKLGV